MKVLRTLAIAYLAWALLYSISFGVFWTIDALAFKLNGGPQLVYQLERAGFKVVGTQVEGDDQFMALSLSKQQIRHGNLDYDWSRDAGTRARRKLKGYRAQRIDEFKQSIRIEKNWAIWSGLDEALGGEAEVIKKAVKNLEIEPKKRRWYAKLEVRFLFRLLSAQLGSNWLVPEILLPFVLIFRLMFIFPVLLPFVVSTALSPPQIAPVTAFLPIAVYALILFIIVRRSKAK